jgi:SAM-dependent methyltransferase
VLDIGCADSEVRKQLGREGHPVIIAEPDSAGDLPFDDASVDTVLLGEFLAEWASRERPIAEARRVLRPNGRLIVVVPYSAGSGGDPPGVSLQELLTAIGEFSVGELATVDGELCLLANRVRERGRPAVWQLALRLAEEELAESEGLTASLRAKVTELEANREREERALDDARSDVERLETALAAAAHQRDLEQERARLARDGVSELERRLKHQAAEAERALADARARLEERQAELELSRSTAEELRRERANEQRTLGLRDSELTRLRSTVREQDRKLALSEARLEKSQQRAERFRASLITLREGRSYRLMRVLWRLRRPFRRMPKDATAIEASADKEADPAPSAAAAPPRAAPPPVAVAKGRRPVRPKGERLRVAVILDEMSQACFTPECELLSLSLEGWAEQLDEVQPDLLLVESAWNANGGEWQYRIAQYPRPDLAGLPVLRALVDGCRERGIPTAFWNKEDPVHFDRFSEAAALFDHVFTTDARCVERYRALPGERTVTPLPFAAQPRIHNPIAAVPERSTSPCFAGAWYRDRHPDRRLALEALLDAARPYGLVIYDRSFGGDDGAFGFPERFAPHVLGKLPYERILDVYKSHRVFLNANSVVDSPTMCSRRVFELAACDTAIVSTPGAALSALLGEGMVEEAGDEVSAGEALARVLGDEGERTRRTRAARRTVFAEHTYTERLATIAEVAGLDASSLRREPFAAPGESSGDAGTGTNGASNVPGDFHPWQLVLAPGVTLAEPALADLAAATTFAEADVIGASPTGNGTPAPEHRYVTDLDPRALLMRRKLIKTRGRPTGTPEQIQGQLRTWSDEGVRLYAADSDMLSPRSHGETTSSGVVA